MSNALPPILTDDEIADITQPLRQGAARARFFRKLGCKVSMKPNGQPLVGRAEFEAATQNRGRAQAAAPVITPDWSKLNARQSTNRTSAR